MGNPEHVHVAHDPVATASVTLLAPRSLATLEDEWISLASHALEPNPFFESFFLRPALDALAGGDDVSVLTVRVRGELAMLLPVATAKRYRGLPVPVMTTWRHLYDALGTPLLHREHAREALGALLDWMATRPEFVLELTDVGADGPVRAAIVDVLRERKALAYVAESHTRAVLRPGAGEAQTYLDNVLDGRKQKEFRRLERRLGETAGATSYREMTKPEEADEFAREFLRIEASGWKAERGTAIASNETHRGFFERVVRGAAARGELDGFVLRAGDAVVAGLCSLKSGDGYFAWKIAYDEAFAKSSPGMLLELENIRRLHGRGPLFMDSCASPDHTVSNRLWSERRILETIALAGGGAGSLLVAAMPLLQWTKRSASTAVGKLRALSR